MTEGPGLGAVWWPAPAKLNLMLRVLGRRPDGYHRLQTVFQFIDRCDYLRFRLRRDGIIRRLNEVPGIPEETDLVVRAARRLQDQCGVGLGVDILLDKRLPIGGGLGGGSSDAATTLVALNQLWGTGLDRDHLVALGGSLGADVPVFLRGRAAWGEGIGDRLTPVDLPEPWYLVLAPACQVSTARVFQDPNLTRSSIPIRIEDFISGDHRNDCLGVVRAQYRPVADAFAWLSHHGTARLTGTGACVFADFPERFQARATLAKVPSGLDGFVARGLNRSPLFGRFPT